MYKKVYQATHPGSVRGADTQALRDRYVIEDLFAPGAVTLNYLHHERLVVGGVAPTSEPVALAPDAEARDFLQRREVAIVNVGGGPGVVTVDGVSHGLETRDALYVPMGAVEMIFAAVPAPSAPRFYVVSAPAHQRFETVRISNATAVPLHRGSPECANARTIYQYIVPATCRSAQLLLGLTILNGGSVWNTLPPHLHERRSEVYFYFGLGDGERVFHFMGEPQETRHLVLENEQAVLSPPWSIHMGAGSRNYAFIWAMGGENLDYTEMQQLDLCQLR